MKFYFKSHICIGHLDKVYLENNQLNQMNIFTLIDLGSFYFTVIVDEYFKLVFINKIHPLF